MRAKYVIINDFDAPEPKMVCQWVDGIGYCYLDRQGTKSSHDGMKGVEATSVGEFGFDYTENPDGTVSFYRSDRAVTATYRDGEPRRWQHGADQFKHRMLANSDAIRIRGRDDGQDRSTVDL